MEEKAQSLAQNIKNFRKRLNMTQEQLGNKVHVTKQGVSQWESGRNTPDMDSIMRLSDVFGVTIDELLGKNRNEYVHFGKITPDAILGINEEKMSNKFGRDHKIQVLHKELHIMSDEELEEIKKAIEFIKFKKQ